MNYKKQIIEEVLNHSLYKATSKDLPEDQKKKIEAYLEKFVENFSMGLIGAFGTVAASDPTKSELQKRLQNLSGSVITKESGDD